MVAKDNAVQELEDPIFTGLMHAFLRPSCKVQLNLHCCFREVANASALEQIHFTAHCSHPALSLQLEHSDVSPLT